MPTVTGPATSPESDRGSPTCGTSASTTIWFTPWYVSPLADGGYDVADYRAIDPAFGTLAEAEALIEEALRIGNTARSSTSSQTTYLTGTPGSGPR